MGILIRALDNFGYLAIWSVLWIVGGIWIVRRAFNLHQGEQAIIGLATGLIIDNWLANILGQLSPGDDGFLAGGWAGLSSRFAGVAAILKAKAARSVPNYNFALAVACTCADGLYIHHHRARPYPYLMIT